MKREEKNALARQRILEAAVGEFSRSGYEGASLTAFCAQHGISKGIVYHHFRDRNELYLLCVQSCFDALTDRLEKAMENAPGRAEERMDVFFQTWLHFFGEHPLYLGIFSDAVFRTPAALAGQIEDCRRGYDALYGSMIASMVEGRQLRVGLDLTYLTGEFQAYMDLFNTRFMSRSSGSWEQTVAIHEKRCRQQLDILFYGILREENSSDFTQERQEK